MSTNIIINNTQKVKYNFCADKVEKQFFDLLPNAKEMRESQAAVEEARGNEFAEICQSHS